MENKVTWMKQLFQPCLVTEKRVSFHFQIVLTVQIDTWSRNEGVCCLMSGKGKLGGCFLPIASFQWSSSIWYHTAEHMLVQVSVGSWEPTVGQFLTTFDSSPLSPSAHPTFSAFYLFSNICFAALCASSWPFVQCSKLTG